MKVYFVRHGKSVAHEQNRFQKKTDSLSELGKKQADYLGRRLQHVPIDKIIASDYTRTKETAEIINSYLHKPLEFSQLFWEYGYPSAIEGVNRDDPVINAMLDEVFGHYGDPNYKHSDEEGFAALAERAKKALMYLTERNVDHLLVVTHGVMINTMVLRMLLGEDMTSQIQNILSHYTMKIDYTGLTVCEYFDGTWQLRHWNDVAHLADID